MNPSFNISTADFDPATSHLFVEAGPASVSMLVLDDKNSFTAVVCYALTATDIGALADEVKEILFEAPLLRHSYRKTAITWNFRESLIVPNEFAGQADHTAMLELVYGPSAKDVTRSDFLFRHHLHNVYRVPEPIDNLLRNKFIFASHTHLHSLLPDMVKKDGAARLWVAFYKGSFTVIIHKDGKLQMVQQFAYSGPDDVAYYLLNACERFGIAPSAAVVELSGMIDTDSNLYTAIYKYFLNISLLSLPEQFEYDPAIREMPAHFFSHLFTAAACV